MIDYPIIIFTDLLTIFMHIVYAVPLTLSDSRSRSS